MVIGGDDGGDEAEDEEEDLATTAAAAAAAGLDRGAAIGSEVAPRSTSSAAAAGVGGRAEEEQEAAEEECDKLVGSKWSGMELTRDGGAAAIEAGAGARGAAILGNSSSSMSMSMSMPMDAPPSPWPWPSRGRTPLCCSSFHSRSGSAQSPAPEVEGSMRPSGVGVLGGGSGDIRPGGEDNELTRCIVGVEEEAEGDARPDCGDDKEETRCCCGVVPTPLLPPLTATATALLDLLALLLRSRNLSRSCPSLTRSSLVRWRSSSDLSCACVSASNSSLMRA